MAQRGDADYVSVTTNDVVGHSLWGSGWGGIISTLTHFNTPSRSCFTKGRDDGTFPKRK
jgi:hypothetical protein